MTHRHRQGYPETPALRSPAYISWPALPAQPNQPSSGSTAGTANTLRIISTLTGEMIDLPQTGRHTRVASMSWDNNNNLYWTDTGDNSATNTIKRVRVTGADEVSVSAVETVRSSEEGTLGAATSGTAGYGLGLRVTSDSPGSQMSFQIGSDTNMDVEFNTADISLVGLGISLIDLSTTNGAKAAKKVLEKAIEEVSFQRTILGTQTARLEFTMIANMESETSLRGAHSRISDTDMAAESVNLTKAQVMAGVSQSMLTQANSSSQSVLRLFQ